MRRRQELFSFGAAREPIPGRRSTHKPRPCPCCGQPGGFCEEHKARLAQIRADLHGEVKVLGRYAQRADQRKRKQPPTCCRPDCWEPRLRGESFCVEHQDIAEDAE
jgi:hypothetical protein